MDYQIYFPNLHIFLQHVGKEISIGNFSIAFYGITIALGMVGALVLATLVAKRDGQDTEVYFDVAILGIIMALIGARLYYVAFRFDLYKDNLLSIFNVREGGLAIYGGIIGGVLATVIVAKWRKRPIGQLFDVAAVGLLFGQMMGRWGNFFNREAFGEYTNNLFAMQLPMTAVRSSDVTELMRANIEVIDGIEFISVHPTFLYESVWNLAVLVLVIVFFPKRKFQGEAFLWYMFGYGVGRFWIEGLRTDQLLLPWGYPVSQALAAVLAVSAFVAVVVMRVRISRKK